MRVKGTSQIVVFNWPFYAAALAAGVLALSINPLLPTTWHLWVQLAVVLGALSVALTLIASWYVYDFGDLYAFDYWPPSEPERIANIHAGFDETSLALQRKFPQAAIDTYDFYDPAKHTEASIRRARARHPAPVRTISIDTTHIPVGADTYDLICLIFAAHEIRDDAERIACFKELRLVARPQASVYVVEHLRDWRNALAYSIGCLHFHSEATWQKTFAASGWRVVDRRHVNAFVISYQLQCTST
jgi:hypothetical protein